MGLKCPFELESVKRLQNQAQFFVYSTNLEKRKRAAEVYTRLTGYGTCLCPCSLFFPVGGPHLFSACVFVLLLKKQKTIVSKS